MPTHAQLAAQLLRDAASFFRTIAEQNEPLKDQMSENAAVFEEVAMLVEADPTAEIAGHAGHGEGEGEGGCCGGHGHHHHDHDHDDEDGECDGNGGCGGKGGCAH